MVATQTRSGGFGHLAPPVDACEQADGSPARPETDRGQAEIDPSALLPTAVEQADGSPEATAPTETSEAVLPPSVSEKTAADRFPLESLWDFYNS